MARAKVARKSTRVDMTPMSDVAFLLLTFFMLTAKFKPDDPVEVVTPSAISTTLLPENNVALVTISKDGKVFFGLDNDKAKQRLIQAFNSSYELGLSASQIHNYVLQSTVGVPLNELKKYLSLEGPSQTNFQQPGIPIDSAEGELGQWIRYTRNSIKNIKELQWVIKADDNTKYAVVNRVLDIFKDKSIHKLHLITSLKALPPGTPAYQTAHSSGGEE